MRAEEEERAATFARQLANQEVSVTLKHTGEAEIIAIALRPEFRRDVLLLDELAARELAKQNGISISGFPGVLLSAVQSGLISAENLRTRLERCRDQGTHYGKRFIQEVYYTAKHGREVIL